MSKLLSDGLNNLLHAGLVNSQLMEPIFFVFSFRNGNVGSDPLGQVFLPHGKAVVPKRNGNGVHFGSIFHCNPLLIGVENNTQRNDAWTHEFLFCCCCCCCCCCCFFFWVDIQTFSRKRKEKKRKEKKRKTCASSNHWPVWNSSYTRIPFTSFNWKLRAVVSEKFWSANNSRAIFKISL